MNSRSIEAPFCLNSRMNILAVEPFYFGSHKAFLKGIEEHSSHTLYTVKLDEKGLKWRMQGKSVRLAHAAQGLGEEMDLLLISSMTNLPAFLALTSPRFAHTPKVMVMHENQFTQPLPEGEERDTTLCYTNYLSMLAADVLLFTSQFHLEDMLDALPEFLSNLQDDPTFDAMETIRAKSRIMTPGLELKHFDLIPDTRGQNKHPVVVWNQRWQFDRNPAMFFRVMNRLFDIDCPFELILAGDTEHDKPAEFDQAVDRYGGMISHMGFVDDPQRYGELLHSGDVVVSTATYEFFCVSIMEAIYCGCHPMVPNRLHYPELIPQTLHKPLLHAPVMYETEDDLFRNLRDLLTGKTRPLPKNSLQSINQHLDWSSMSKQYDEMFLELAKTPSKSVFGSG